MTPTTQWTREAVMQEAFTLHASMDFDWLEIRFVLTHYSTCPGALLESTLDDLKKLYPLRERPQHSAFADNMISKR